MTLRLGCLLAAWLTFGMGVAWAEPYDFTVNVELREVQPELRNLAVLVTVAGYHVGEQVVTVPETGDFVGPVTVRVEIPRDRLLEMALRGGSTYTVDLLIAGEGLHPLFPGHYRSATTRVGPFPFQP